MKVQEFDPVLLAEEFDKKHPSEILEVAWISPDLPLTAVGARARKSKNPWTRRRVASDTTTPPAVARCSRRDAKLVVSPTAV